MTVRCPVCQFVGPPKSDAGGSLKCSNTSCGVGLKVCQNQLQYGACNQAVLASEAAESLCRYCRLNRVVPNLNDPVRLKQWKLLEAAKHRTLAAMEEAGFPVPPSNDDKGPMLYFEFKDDLNGPVTTGHLNGCITIYLKEADSVFREVNRVEFGEAQRTLIGHFRHELGHYFWDRVVAPGPISQFRSVFGDETNPTYATAQAKYYSDGPLPRWQLSFVSAYASMHPWEDFAETFGLYQDIHAVLTTNSHFNASDADLTDLDAMVKGYRELGIFVNELNRDMGLQDLVPEVFNDTITGKLRFIHSLRSI